MEGQDQKSNFGDTQDTEAQVIDVENLDSTKNLFDKMYGEKIVQDAEMRSKKMVNELGEKMKHMPQMRPKDDESGGKGTLMLKEAQLSQMQKEKRYPGGWTNTTLDLLETWYHACIESSKAHEEAAKVCRKKFRMISIPTLIVGTAATALSFFTAGDSCDPEDDDSNGLKYGVAFLTSLVSVLGGINALYNFNTKMKENILAAGSFANLARRTSLEIYLPNDTRGNCEVVLTEVSLEFANLTMNSPLL